jgi:methionine synthase II (cobalamin-independent)
MPHKDPCRALDLILETCPQAPCWPQLPNLGFQENMMAQFCEGIPCVRIDPERKKVFFERPESGPEELTAFYENVFAAERTGDLGAFALPESAARGFAVFLERFAKRRDSPPLFLKGQITGPLTFGLSVLDAQGLPALFDDTLSDVIRQAIRLKALWQVERLKACSPHGILFVDEPVLAGFGSAAFVNLSRRDAVATLREVFSAVKAAGFRVGSHCCANTDWSLMVEAGVDIINFDAYAYLESIGLYAEALTGFLKGGGFLAWGMVPSQQLDSRPGPQRLLQRVARGIEALVDRGLPREELTRNLILTTSCGLGTLSEEAAERALAELAELSCLVREKLTA